MAGRAGFDLTLSRPAFELCQTIAMVTIPKQRTAFGQLNMQAGRPVTRFAADVDLGESRVIAVGRQIKILLQIGRVAIGAHGVPVLRDAGPVQRIARLETFVLDVGRSHIEPLAFYRVPRDSQHLHPAIGKLNHILLQRPECQRCT